MLGSEPWEKDCSSMLDFAQDYIVNVWEFQGRPGSMEKLLVPVIYCGLLRCWHSKVVTTTSRMCQCIVGPTQCSGWHGLWP